MSANIQFFTDIDCTSELEHPGAFYDLVMGPITGLDGDAGDRSDIKLYMKNTGDQTALNTTVLKDGDESNRVQLSDGVNGYVANNLSYGDILAGHVKELLIKLVVPAGTDMQVCSPKLYTKFSTLP